jgi:hypothetical protein
MESANSVFCTLILTLETLLVLRVHADFVKLGAFECKNTFP